VADANLAAESRCICGKVKLQFLRAMPVLHVHCCCSDCRQGREWLASMGGPPLRQASTELYYFENNLAPVEPHALSLLFTAKLRENGRTTRLVTQCCYSMLAIDHPYYEKNVVCVHANACDLVAPRVEPLGRIFSRDWDTAYDGEMPPAIARLEESETMWKEFAGVIKRPRTGAQGIRLQDIFTLLPPTKDLRLQEKVRLLPPLVGSVDHGRTAG
jgi:hypothetical protein